MSLIKKCFGFYVFANIHVGLAAFSLTQITMKAYGIENDALAYFVFFSTVLSYNYIRVVRLGNKDNMIGNWFMSNKLSLIILNGLCLIAIIYLSTSFRFSDLLVLFPFFLLSVFYVFPLSSKMKGFRQIPGLKLIIISFAWAGVTVYFPLYASQLLESEDVWIIFFQRFLFVMAITIPFDIRDTRQDLPDLKTLPQLMGVGNSKVLAVLLIVAFQFLDYYRVPDQGTFAITGIVSVISILLILGAGERQHRFYSSFWVESIPILWYVLLLISE